jgi:hypothetical protein
MLQRLTGLLFFVFCVVELFPQFQGPVAAISEGFGAEGPYQVALNITPSPLWPGINVSVYSPVGGDVPAPVIFFAHGFNANYAFLYHNLLQHFASRGYVAVFSPYPGMAAPLLTPVTILERYDVLWEGFRQAVHEFPDLIDSTRVGFIGHSFGAGAVPAMTKRAINSGWGSNGCFMMPLAPWYFYDISEEELQNFAPQTKLLMQVYEGDIVNDHRLAIDIFNHISIADNEKDFVEVFSDNYQGYFYNADHGLPETFSLYNALDSYAVFRLADALADYSFRGNPDAKTVALGNGSPEQINMGPLKPLLVSDNPSPVIPPSNYLYRCDNYLNPRIDFCAGLGIDDPEMLSGDISIFPNPARDVLYVESKICFNDDFLVEIFDLSGRVLYCRIFEPRSSFSLDVSGCDEGLYFLRIQSFAANYQGRFLIQKK